MSCAGEIHLTPLERLISDMRTEALIRSYEAQMAFDRKAAADLKALCESHRRSIGQQFRWLAKRLAAKLHQGVQ